MAAGFIIAVMLCTADNCDMVQVEPGVSYRTYEECSAATAKKSALISRITERNTKDQGRAAEIVCLRSLQAAGDATPAGNPDIPDGRGSTARRNNPVPPRAPHHIAGEASLAQSAPRTDVPAATRGLASNAEPRIRIPEAPPDPGPLPALLARPVPQEGIQPERRPPEPAAVAPRQGGRRQEAMLQSRPTVEPGRVPPTGPSGFAPPVEPKGQEIRRAAGCTVPPASGGGYFARFRMALQNDGGWCWGYIAMPQIVTWGGESLVVSDVPTGLAPLSGQVTMDAAHGEVRILRNGGQMRIAYRSVPGYAGRDMFAVILQPGARRLTMDVMVSQ